MGLLASEKNFDCKHDQGNLRFLITSITRVEYQTETVLRSGHVGCKKMHLDELSGVVYKRANR